MAHKNSSNWSPYKARQKEKKKDSDSTGGGRTGAGAKVQAMPTATAAKSSRDDSPEGKPVRNGVGAASRLKAGTAKSSRDESRSGPSLRDGAEAASRSKAGTAKSSQSPEGKPLRNGAKVGGEEKSPRPLREAPREHKFLRDGRPAPSTRESHQASAAGSIPGDAPASPTRQLRGTHRRPVQEFSFSEADDRIYDVFRNHDFGDYPHAKRQQLTRFYQLLMSNQNEQNFTRLLTPRDVAIKHFIDSLIVTKLTTLQFPLLDMGTGPGFPGLPLKIHFPEEKIILAEGVQKRVEFLKRVREELALKNLAIIGRNVNLEFFYPVRTVITRAVEDARNTLGNVVNCLQTGGDVVLMKGPNCDPEIQMALDTWGEYFALHANLAYEIPKTPNERRLLIFRKLKPHPLPDFEALDLAWEKEHGASVE